MSVLAIFMIPLISVLHVALSVYMYIVIVAAVISWVSPDPYNPIVRFLYSMTEPVFSAIRERLPLRNMAIDLSPMIVILAIVFLQELLTQIALQFR